MIIGVFLSSSIVSRCLSEDISSHFLVIRYLVEYLYSSGYLLFFCPCACIRITASYNLFIRFIKFI